jgi:hypothetical protein
MAKLLEVWSNRNKKLIKFLRMQLKKEEELHMEIIVELQEIS